MNKKLFALLKSRDIFISIFLAVLLCFTSLSAQTIVGATGGTNVSLDNSSLAVSPGWTILTGPVVTESIIGEFVESDYLLFLPTTWQFDVTQPVSISVSGGDATFALSAVSYVPTARILTFHVSAVSTTRPVTLTFSNIRIQPVTKVTSIDMLRSTIKTNANFGTINSVVGAPRNFRIAAASNSIAATNTDQLTLSITDQFQNLITTYDGTRVVTFSGLGTAPDATSIPTVTNSGSTAIPFGTGTAIHFTAGVSDGGGLLTAYKAEGPVTINATDGTISTTSPGGSGVQLTVSPGAVSYATSKVSVTPSIINPGALATVTLQAKDLVYNDIKTGGATVVFALNGGTSAGLFGNVTDNNNGSYTSIFTGVTEGSPATINASYNGTDITSTLPTLTVATAGLASGYRITSSINSFSASATNQLAIKIVDANQLTVTSFTGVKTITFNGLGTAPNGTSIPTVTNASGVAIPLGTSTEIHFTAGVSDGGGLLTAYKAEGPVILNATDGTISTSTAGGLGISLTISPASVSYAKSIVSVNPSIINPGLTSTVTLQAKDLVENDIKTGGAIIVFSLSSGTSTGTFGAVTDNHDGSYNSIFTGGAAGTAATINASYNGNIITSTLPSITVAPLVISTATSTVSVSSPTVVAGNSVTITLQAKTASSTNLSVGGGIIVFTNTGGTSTGTISAVTDRGDGTYTATFTGNTAGTATTINATVDGVAVTTTMPTVTVTYASVAYLKAVPASVSMITGTTNEITLTAFDLFGNIVQSYSGAKTITFTGLQTAETIEGSTSSATVNFISGVSTSGSLTFLANVARNAYLNFSDGTVGTATDISYAARIVITAAIPDIPVATAATTITTSTFIANWVPSASATGYFIDVATDQAFNIPVSGYINLSVGNVTFVKVSGLTSNTTYYYRVRAGNAISVSDNSNVISLKTLLAIPDAPVAKAATLVGSNDFTANWFASNGATGYFLDVALDNLFNSPVSGYIGKGVGNVTSFKVTGLNITTTYYYRVRAYNSQGESSNSNVITVNTLVGIEELSSEMPTSYKLFQNYPNPFNPTTKIQFSIPKSGMVKVTVYNILGQEVAILLNQQLSQGLYSVNFDATKLDNGIYFYNIQSGDFSQTKKMILMK